jgi:hypothetical protein
MPETDDDLVRLARLWLDRHGESAITVARDMVAEFREAGNTDAADRWLRVIIAIEELQQVQR